MDLRDPASPEPFSLMTLSAADLSAVQTATTTILGVLHQGSVEIGRQLAIVKAILPHGAFAKWVQTELGISPRSASRYLELAKFLEGKSAKLAELPQGLVERLASPKLQTNVVDGVIAAVEDGQPIDDVKRQIDRAEEDIKDGDRIRLRGLSRTGREPTAEEVKQRLQAQRRREKLDHERWAKERADHEAALEQARPSIQRLAERVGSRYTRRRRHRVAGCAWTSPHLRDLRAGFV